MTSSTAAFICPPERARLPFPYRPEADAVDAALARAGALDWPAVMRTAAPWVAGVRANPAPFWAMESLLREYPISSAEGLALMRLAEALLRVPDTATAVALTADQLGRADFDGESDGAPGGPHRMLASLSASAIALSKKILPDAEHSGGLLQRLGAKTVVAATVRAIGLLGRQFVLGRDIDEAIDEANGQRRKQSALRYSYDMLGEGARTERDAERYLASYGNAIEAIARFGVAPGREAAASASRGPEAADGISIKLSALFSRYEVAHRARVFAELLPRVWRLVEPAAKANLNLTIDAEESDRLELSLDVFEALAERIAAVFPQWRGFGLAIQAYQTRALEAIDEVARIARANRLRFMVRLVKGAYWDGEIKRAQELGLAGYPVFTHKGHTDTAYLAGARALVGHADVIYPQFATHNAGTIAAVVQMAQATGAKFELQRLHGMGEGVFRELSRKLPLGDMTPTPPAPPARGGGLITNDIPVRIYAPVGEHRDLLAYLVRRLLENGANSSFVHQLADEAVAAAVLLASPLSRIGDVALPLPRKLYGASRLNSQGVDLACLAERAPLHEALSRAHVEPVPEAGPVDVDAAMARLAAGFAGWNATPAAERAAILRSAADRLEAKLPEFCALLVTEAHKTLGDCVAEVREAVDFLRYYAGEAERRAGDGLPGCGIFVCISPWNFPLAIFAGQVAAALAAGNAVAAKPAEQTPFVALRCVELLHEAGVPASALALLHGPGETVGARLVADARTAGVCFTGSTPVARHIHRSLSAKAGPPVPLIAETGGLNAMIVDSTALPEQVVDAVVQSAFRSTGQRCSALRLLCVHESIAEGLLEMLAGAMAELQVGDARLLATDVGPVIDVEAHANLSRHIERLRRTAKLIAEAPVGDPPQPGNAKSIAPIAFELARIGELSEEIFGPVLHVVRWGGEVDTVVDQINALGYGLTLGVQTRIDSRAQRIADRAHVGNVYVNRNMIGAVVGVQPFGGEGSSGTGPKAGGPHYLDRFLACPAPADAPRTQVRVPATAAAMRTVPTLPGTAFARLETAFARWSARTLAERTTTVQRACLRWPAAHAPAALAAAARALADQALPGPTGESNTLRLHPRGVFALLADGAADVDVTAALAAALLAGNSVALVGAAAGASMREAFVAAGGEAEAIGLFDADQATALLAAPALGGVAALASDPHAGRGAAQALARRDGPILPLIPLAEASRADRLWRWCSEQTLTVNTAAAGGNAELLAAAGQQPLAQAAAGG